MRRMKSWRHFGCSKGGHRRRPFRGSSTRFKVLEEMLDGCGGGSPEMLWARSQEEHLQKVQQEAMIA